MKPTIKIMECAPKDLGPATAVMAGDGYTALAAPVFIPTGIIIKDVDVINEDFLSMDLTGGKILQQWIKEEG